MQYRRVGNSGLKVSTVSIGAWLTFGNDLDGSQSKAVLRAAVEGGINHIDTADVYARGRAEIVVGEFLREVKRRHVVLSTKCFWPMSDDPNDRGLSRKHIFDSVHDSLRRLQTDYIDIFYCHRFDDGTPLHETVTALSDLVSQGKILYWGTSVWSAQQLQMLQSTAAQKGWTPAIVEQPCYNLLQRDIEKTVLPVASGMGMGVICWSPLAGGLLTGKYNGGQRPPGSRAAQSQWLDDLMTPKNMARIQALTELAEKLSVTPSQLALSWLLHRPGVTSVITGATRPEHVASNLVAADLQLDKGVIKKIDKMF